MSNDQSEIVDFLLWTDYFIKGMHMHSWLENKVVKLENRFSMSHEIIRKSDAKFPILLGDLYNFKAMKIASKLNSKALQSTTEIQELFSKVTQDSGSFNTTFPTNPEYKFVFGFYYNILKVILATKHAAQRYENEDVLAKIAGTITKLHPKDSILSYHM